MVESTVQGKMYQLTLDLEETAMELGMKLRFLDAIRESKQRLQNPLSKQELQKEMLELDELAAQIKRVIAPESKEIAVNDVTTVSEDEVRDRIRGLLDECSKMNMVIARESFTSEVYIQHTERDMHDFAKAEANYDIIIDSQRFMESFQKIGKNHNKQMNEMTDRYVEETSANYDNTVKRIGSMLSDIKDQRLKFGSKELYHQWSERYESVKAQLKGKMRELDKGGNEITAFGEANGNEIAKIVKTEQKKCRRKKCMPIFILAGIIILFLVIVLGTAVSTVNNVSDAIATEIEQDGLTETLKNVDKNLGTTEKVIKKAGNILNSFGIKKVKIFSLPVIAPVIVILGTLYFLYVKQQNKKSKALICEKTGKYLEEKLEKFFQEKRLEKQLEQSYEQVIKNVADTYENILKEIFGTVLYDERQDEQNSTGKMLKLIKEWEQIKRGGI